MSLALQEAHKLIEKKLHEREYAHLLTNVEGGSIYIYSVEQGEKAYRAALTLCRNNEFSISLTDPKGYWQPTNYRGDISAMAELLTSKFAFALTRWPPFA